MENLIGIWDIVCLRVQLDKNQLEKMDKNGGSAWDVRGMLRIE